MRYNQIINTARKDLAFRADDVAPPIGSHTTLLKNYRKRGALNETGNTFFKGGNRLDGVAGTGGVHIRRASDVGVRGRIDRPSAFCAILFYGGALRNGRSVFCGVIPDFEAARLY